MVATLKLGWVDTSFEGEGARAPCNQQPFMLNYFMLNYHSTTYVSNITSYPLPSIIPSMVIPAVVRSSRQACTKRVWTHR